jgi:tungstate transport system ATP-binding protein
MTVAIEARGLTKSYGKRTVVSVDSLQIHEQEVLAILGPNGAGKSTLFRLLALLSRSDAGSIEYWGKSVDVRDLAARRRTAAVFQRPLLFQGSVEDNIRFALRFHKLHRSHVRPRIERTLELMGITNLAGADIRSLSGGELQRVALARALALEPDILFLDEPTSNLDIHVRRRFREDLRRVVDSLAVTVVIITHEYGEALALARRVAVMQEGSIAQIGTPEEVFAHPNNAFVAEFTGAETVWHGQVTGCEDGLCTLRADGGVTVQVAAQAEAGRRVVLAIRPEDVAISLPSEGRSAQHGEAWNNWPGMVDSVTPAGPLVRVVVRLEGSVGVQSALGDEGRVICLITRASAEQLGVDLGTPVTASVKAAAVHLLDG